MPILIYPLIHNRTVGKTKMNISTGKYFGQGLVFTGVILLLASPLFFSQLIPFITLCLVGLILIFSDYKLEIDLRQEYYNEYLSTFGIRYSIDTYPCSSFKYLYINKANYSQQLNYKSISTATKTEEFNGYLLTENDVKIHIFRSKRKETVLSKLEQLSIFLDIEIIENFD